MSHVFQSSADAHCPLAAGVDVMRGEHVPLARAFIVGPDHPGTIAETLAAAIDAAIEGASA